MRGKITEKKVEEIYGDGEWRKLIKRKMKTANGKQEKKVMRK